MTRRPAGWLAQEIIALLAKNGPETGQGIAVRLQQCHPHINQTAVFIWVKRLLARGRIQRIETTKSYAVSPTEDPVHLLCEVCGRHDETAAPEASDLLRQLTQAKRFEVGRLVLEVVGVCKRCRDQPARPASPRRSGTERAIFQVALMFEPAS